MSDNIHNITMRLARALGVDVDNTAVQSVTLKLEHGRWPQIVVALTPPIEELERLADKLEAADSPVAEDASEIERYRQQLGNRACDALLRAGITTLHQLAATGDARLLEIPWFGVGSLERVHATLDAIDADSYGATT